MKTVFEYKTLNEISHLKDDLLKLIEGSFNYENDNHFIEDFAPLMDEKNESNLHCLLDGEKIISHTGVLIKKIEIEGSFHKIAFLGGIVTDRAYQGKGLAKNLLEKVMSIYNNQVCLFILWSEKVEFYQKFGFNLALPQFEYKQTNSYNTTYQFNEKNIPDLTAEEWSLIKSQYNLNKLKGIHPIERTEQDWDIIRKMNSVKASLIYREGQLFGYYFKNKGQDLTNTIHEFYLSEDTEQSLTALAQNGNVWSPQKIDSNLESNSLYGGLVKIGSPENFSAFINKYSNNNIRITEINNDIKFYFNDHFYEQNYQDFLQGILGPTIYEEFEPLYSPLYICGVDSI